MITMKRGRQARSKRSRCAATVQSSTRVGLVPGRRARAKRPRTQFYAPPPTISDVLLIWLHESINQREVGHIDLITRLRQLCTGIRDVVDHHLRLEFTRCLKAVLPQHKIDWSLPLPDPRFPSICPVPTSKIMFKRHHSAVADVDARNENADPGAGKPTKIGVVLDNAPSLHQAIVKTADTTRLRPLIDIRRVLFWIGAPAYISCNSCMMSFHAPMGRMVFKHPTTPKNIRARVYRLLYIANVPSMDVVLGDMMANLWAAMDTQREATEALATRVLGASMVAAVRHARLWLAAVIGKAVSIDCATAMSVRMLMRMEISAFDRDEEANNASDHALLSIPSALKTAWNALDNRPSVYSMYYDPNHPVCRRISATMIKMFLLSSGYAKRCQMIVDLIRSLRFKEGETLPLVTMLKQQKIVVE